MQPLESGLKPFEVRVSAFYSFLQDCSLDVVADVGLLEYSSFSLLELGDCDADIFCREEGTRGDFQAGDGLGEMVAGDIVIEWLGRFPHFGLGG